MRSKESELLEDLAEYDRIVGELQGWITIYRSFNLKEKEFKAQKVLDKAVEYRELMRQKWNDFIIKERTPKKYQPKNYKRKIKVY